MPKVNYVKAARKPKPEIGVGVGESYYWWKHKLARGGLVRCSKTRPRPSQLNLSEYYSRLFSIQEQLEDFEGTRDDFRQHVEGMVSELEELRDEQQEKRDNMPENLQESSTGELLGERYDSVDSYISDLQSIDFDDEEQSLEDLKDEVTSLSCD